MKIAITGKMCSGKTTLSKYLVSIEPRFQVFSFGKKVKEVASDLFQMDPNFKDRSLLTSIGQKMREIEPDVWANYVINQTKDLNYCIIDDLRYQNEYELLAKEGWKIIQLNISKELQEQRIQSIYPENYQDHLKNRTHASERNSFQWLNEGPDLIIDTSQDKEDIHKLIHSFIQ
tara:strand:+ start:644 stop:1165 length:522 start_codon:yes stop_codon:yes gene_type:complete